MRERISIFLRHAALTGVDFHFLQGNLNALLNVLLHNQTVDTR
jgi:hypothetical protein